MKTTYCDSAFYTDAISATGSRHLAFQFFAVMQHGAAAFGFICLFSADLQQALHAAQQMITAVTWRDVMCHGCGSHLNNDVQLLDFIIYFSIISLHAYVSSGADYCFWRCFIFFLSHLEVNWTFFIHKTADNRHCATIRYLWTTVWGNGAPTRACWGHRLLNPPKNSKIRAGKSTYCGQTEADNRKLK